MKVIKLNAIDSTNSYLKELVKSGVPDDHVVVAATRQLNGRGQLGSYWQSEPGKSLTFSLLKRFGAFPVSEQSKLMFIVSLALIKVLRSYEIPMVSVKWPNDIMSRQQKLAGILIENQIKGGHIVSSVIGIGLNVNETEFSNLPQAGSMKLASGRLFDLEQVLQNTATMVFQEIETLEKQDIAALQAQYESELFRKDVVSVFETPDGILKNGRIMGVTLAGNLKVVHEHNNIVAYDLKKVKLLF